MAGTKERVLVELELEPRQSPNLSDRRSEPDLPQPSLERVTQRALDRQDVWQTLKIVQKSILRQLASLPLAVGEMGLVAALSVVGTLIAQNEAPAYYVEHYPTATAARTSAWLDSNLILGLQWDHIYTADYFLALLALLAASLAACSYTRQWPMVRVARRWAPRPCWSVRPWHSLHSLHRAERPSAASCPSCTMDSQARVRAQVEVCQQPGKRARTRQCS